MRRIGLAVVALVTAACGGEVGEPDGTQHDEVVVVSTVAPITDLVREVAGDRVLVEGLVPDGIDSHTYEPAPDDARALAEADLLIANGLFLEQPILDLAEQVDGLRIVTLGERTISRDEWVFDFSFPADGGVPNPHLWLDVTLAMAYVEHIAGALVSMDPAGERAYRDAAAAYLEQLETLDAAIEAAIATIPESNRKLVTYHDSWAYFGPRYGITVVGAVQPSDFSEPSAAEVRVIIDQVRREAVPAVFGSEVFPSDVLRTIAEETGATYVEDLADDELPGPPDDPQHSYVGMMVRNVRLVVDHLGGDSSGLDGLLDEPASEEAA